MLLHAMCPRQFAPRHVPGEQLAASICASVAASDSFSVEAHREPKDVAARVLPASSLVQGRLAATVSLVSGAGLGATSPVSHGDTRPEASELQKSEVESGHRASGFFIDVLANVTLRHALDGSVLFCDP